ncbi:hypothetical protein AB0P21_23210 [Kribbella sp. NPDC056861]|uniref:hypothetical protein n=1 Tax=Kribbella sp. NPDC056861 TaxID=3154857 RepID=UPI0034352CD0
MIRKAACTLVGLASLAGSLVAFSAPASAAGCHYRIVWNVAGVYNSPQQNPNYLIKTKQRGDIVGDYCTYTINDGYYWNIVALGGGGVGYMRADSMVRV